MVIEIRSFAAFRVFGRLLLRECGCNSIVT
jgi:hypothetical protein